MYRAWWQRSQRSGSASCAVEGRSSPGHGVKAWPGSLRSQVWQNWQCVSPSRCWTWVGSASGFGRADDAVRGVGVGDEVALTGLAEAGDDGEGLGADDVIERVGCVERVERFARERDEVRAPDDFGLLVADVRGDGPREVADDERFGMGHGPSFRGGTSLPRPEWAAPARRFKSSPQGGDFASGAKHRRVAGSAPVGAVVI